MKTIQRLIGCGILALLCVGMVLLAQNCPNLLYAWYPSFSRDLLAKIGALTAKLPVSLAELIVALIILWALFTLIRALRGKSSLLGWFFGAIEGILLAVTLFLAIWGLNYFDPTSLSDRLGLEVTGYTTDQLYTAAEYYLNQANGLSEQVTRDESGAAALGTFRELAQWSGEGYEVLSEEYDCFASSQALPKPAFCSRILSYSGITGIFTCWTGEANVNRETPQVSLPFTMAHERAHAQAICPEDECNFVAYLACMASGRAECQYSGAYSAFVYCYNALYDQSTSRAAELWNQMAPGLKTDVVNACVHYEQYEGKVQDAAEKVNDTYLKTMQQTDGVRSYGEVVDLLIAWQLKNG